MYRYTFICGDWSKDGHNQSDKRIIKSNVDKVILLKYLNVSLSKLNFDEIKSFDDLPFCSDYEDNKLDFETFKPFLNYLYDIKITDEPFEDDYEVWGSDEYFETIQDFIKWGAFLLGESDKLTLEFEKEPETIFVGGYGIYF